MKRFKFIMITTAIVLAVGYAYATKPCQACTYADQYRFGGGVYIGAGVYGYDYLCIEDVGVCTYYKPDPFLRPNYYAPCRYGNYTPIPPINH